MPAARRQALQMVFPQVVYKTEVISRAGVLKCHKQPKCKNKKKSRTAKGKAADFLNLFSGKIGYYGSYAEFCMQIIVKS